MPYLRIEKETFGWPRAEWRLRFLLQDHRLLRSCPKFRAVALNRLWPRCIRIVRVSSGSEPPMRSSAPMTRLGALPPTGLVDQESVQIRSRFVGTAQVVSGLALTVMDSTVSIREQGNSR